MVKRKITQRQAARIKHLQTKQLAEADATETVCIGSPQTGLVVAHYGSYVDIETADQLIQRCHLRQHIDIVVGDNVVWQLGNNGSAVIVAVQPRQSSLSRPISIEKSKTIAANIDQIFLVIAPQPFPPANLIDSYLVAAETLKIRMVLVFNKMDLMASMPSAPDILKKLDVYRKLDYLVLQVSAKTEDGLSDLVNALANRTSIFVGQSGVGKSSLVSKLLPKEQVRVDTYSDAGNRGMHTTTTARLYQLANSGRIIDSPGVRDFMLWGMPRQKIVEGFREMKHLLSACKFRDCTHTHEPGCAILTAVEAGEISQERYASLQRIIETLATS